MCVCSILDQSSFDKFTRTHRLLSYLYWSYCAKKKKQTDRQRTIGHPCMWKFSLSTCHDLHLRSSSIYTWTFVFVFYNLIFYLTNLCLLVPPDNSNIWFIPSITYKFPRTVECIADNDVLPASNRIFTINVECKLSFNKKAMFVFFFEI
jgi:hypothetical protein